MFYTLIGTVVCQVAVLIFGLVLNQGDFDLLNGDDSLMNNSLVFRCALFASSSIGTFLLPVLWLQRTNANTNFYEAADRRDWKSYVAAGAFLLAFSPLMDLIGRWNMEMTLPESLKAVETWMRQHEDSASVITEKLVMVSSIHELLVNLIVIAVLPGIAEEFFFRGALQNIFTRIFKNPHVAIWFVGLVFSAIHMQFFGFFPRMILGVILGYFYLWTKNIWVPVFAHFLNNASVVVVAFVYTRSGKSYSELVTEGLSYSIIAYLGSLILSVLLGIAMYRYTQSKNKYARRLD